MFTCNMRRAISTLLTYLQLFVYVEFLFFFPGMKRTTTYLFDEFLFQLFLVFCFDMMCVRGNKKVFWCLLRWELSVFLGGLGVMMRQFIQRKSLIQKKIIHWHLFVISLIIICGQTNYKKKSSLRARAPPKISNFFSPQTLLSVSTKTSILFLFQQTLYTEYLQETVSEHDLWVMNDVQTYLANGFFYNTLIWHNGNFLLNKNLSMRLKRWMIFE